MLLQYFTESWDSLFWAYSKKNGLCYNFHSKVVFVSAAFKENYFVSLRFCFDFLLIVGVVIDHVACYRKGKEIFYLTTHSTHFIYGYMASDHSVKEETRCRHMGYSFRLTARVLLYAPSHRQDSTYHSLCYTSRGALAGTRNRITDVSV